MSSIEEKLAARRKELEEQEAVQRAAEKDLADAQRHKEQAALQQKVQEELDASGLSKVIKKPAVATPNADKVAAEIDKILSDEAQSRWTKQQNIFLVMMIAFSIYGFFQAWWFGLVVLVFAFGYLDKTNKEYKAQILKEAEAESAK